MYHILILDRTRVLGNRLYARFVYYLVRYALNCPLAQTAVITSYYH